MGDIELTFQQEIRNLFAGLGQKIDALGLQVQALDGRLGAVEQRLDKKIDHLDQKLERGLEGLKLNFELRFEEHRQAVNKQIAEWRDEQRAQLDSVQRRLDLQAGLIQSGTRALLKFARWSDVADTQVMRLLQELADLKERINRLEGGGKTQ